MFYVLDTMLNGYIDTIQRWDENNGLVGRFVYINVILSVGYFSFWSRTEDYISAGDK